MTWLVLLGAVLLVLWLAFLFCLWRITYWSGELRKVGEEIARRRTGK